MLAIQRGQRNTACPAGYRAAGSLDGGRRGPYALPDTKQFRPAMSTERALDLAEEFFRRARHRVPVDWLRTDLTMPQLKVLLTLYLDGPQTCGSLASALGLSLPTMTGILGRLERGGYLLRSRDQEDGRRVISGLSSQGDGIVERLWAAGREELAGVLAGVGARDLQTVERALEILIDALNSETTPRPASVASERT